MRATCHRWMHFALCLLNNLHYDWNSTWWIQWMLKNLFFSLKKRSCSRIHMNKVTSSKKFRIPIELAWSICLWLILILCLEKKRFQKPFISLKSDLIDSVIVGILKFCVIYAELMFERIIKYVMLFGFRSSYRYHVLIKYSSCWLLRSKFVNVEYYQINVTVRRIARNHPKWHSDDCVEALDIR